MPRPSPVDHLVGAAEIAERLGIGQTDTVHSWKRRHDDFPAPLRELRMGLVWWWPDVEKWARSTGRL
ncbi:MAG TPA: hypothetical protein VFU19_11480 [Iamia sp.]|nr:hypothetical protein [Iamia sp.]